MRATRAAISSGVPGDEVSGPRSQTYKNPTKVTAATNHTGRLPLTLPRSRLRPGLPFFIVSLLYAAPWCDPGELDFIYAFVPSFEAQASRQSAPTTESPISVGPALPALMMSAREKSRLGILNPRDAATQSGARARCTAFQTRTAK
jgi:hypothetical protein